MKNSPPDFKTVKDLNELLPDYSPGKLTSQDSKLSFSLTEDNKKFANFDVTLGRATAFGTFRKDKKYAAIGSIKTPEDLRRKGYASKLISEIEARAAELGLHEIRGEAQLGSEEFWEKLGYSLSPKKVGGRLLLNKNLSAKVENLRRRQEFSERFGSIHVADHKAAGFDGVIYDEGCAQALNALHPEDISVFAVRSYDRDLNYENGLPASDSTVIANAKAALEVATPKAIRSRSKHP